MSKARKNIKKHLKRNPIARHLFQGAFKQRRKEDKREKVLKHWMNDDAKAGKGLFSDK